jgi:pimeloyl-ACP methyl ester carboxylesterase
MKKLILVFTLPIILSFNCLIAGQRAEAKKDECVILLHGLGRSSRSMVKLEKNLTEQGYRVLNVNYLSTKHPIEYLADELLDSVIQEWGNKAGSRLHFVTHSMGGIVVRYYLKQHKLPNLGRVVMISPPNQGSELVDQLKDKFVFDKSRGPAARQLGTDKNSFVLNLGPVDFELGIIAGSRSMNPFYSSILPGPDDGVVTVERTKVEGMTDFLVMPYSHRSITKKKKVIAQATYFLEHGSFNHSTNKGKKGTPPFLTEAAPFLAITQGHR